MKTSSSRENKGISYLHDRTSPDSTSPTFSSEREKQEEEEEEEEEDDDDDNVLKRKIQIPTMTAENARERNCRERKR
ncbi:hypothetical protein L484_012751 [Morus notabilis]|uniref:Uncharacterized protein n=1 Tax=Morus notabilis TaxID=981085 RepID=W9R7S5_9ROSA|nr:hypothetical protein L484_012751 [Morus notabilis]